MKIINDLMLKDIANKLFLELKEEHLNLLVDEINIIEKEMSYLNEIPEMKDISPMTFPFEAFSHAREDEPGKAMEANEVIKNAEKTKDGYIVLPKVI